MKCWALLRYACGVLAVYCRELDEQLPDGSRPEWSFLGPQPQLGLRRDAQGSNLSSAWLVQETERQQEMLGNGPPNSITGPFPPWVSGWQGCFVAHRYSAVEEYSYLE